MKKAFKIAVAGLVQGVGFRPFVYKLALNFKLSGDVFNDESGVKIHIFGEEKNCLDFIESLKTKSPVLARIDDLSVCEIKISKNASKEFKILPSKRAKKIAPILSDFAICDECKNEFYDSKNPRYHHAFITCTNCGPRFSIINALPYDRSNTSMAGFKLCKNCKKEYLNPLDRRFHAQPIACNNCGPRAYLKDFDGNILASDTQAFKMAGLALKNGKILAIKGLGGFHLCVDALNAKAIKELRKKKNRPHKPFAIMLKDSTQSALFAKLSKAELDLLNSPQKPIILVKKNKQNFNKNYLEQIAPKLDKIGIFLAPTSFNLLLFEYFKNPLIATSANLSSEPIISDFDALKSKLGGVFELALDHNRKIINPSDDSIAFSLNLGNNLAPIRQFLRTSRGFKPSIINTNFNKKSCILALGGELKNSFAIYKDGLIFLSPYIGDLKNISSFERFLNLLDFYKKTYDLKFDLVVGDLHPHFMHTQYFESLGYEILKIQHHQAHIYSVLCEHNLKFDSKILAFGFDGTGFGQNGEIWGGEIFKNTPSGLKRVFHFDDFLLIGGQNAIKNINFLTFAILQKYNIDAPKFYSKLGDKFNSLKSALNASKIRTSSLGRIFDGLACLLCGLDEISFDGQGAMSLEALYDESLNICYEFSLNDEIINFKGIFEKAIKDEPKVVATGFINAVAKLIFDISQNEYVKDNEIGVVLGGGVFANYALLKRTLNLLNNAGIRYYLPRQNPAGDEGLALGQLYYALNI